MRATNFHIVRIESQRERKMEYDGVSFDLPALSTRIEGSDGKTLAFNPDLYITTNGIVESVANILPEQDGFVEAGYPTPLMYIGSEMISARNATKKPWEHMGNESYCPSTFELTPKYSDQVYDTDINVGDKVFFHHTQTSNDNKLSENTYLVDYKSVVAIERNGVLMAANGYVLLDRKEEDSSIDGILIFHQDKYVKNMGVIRNAPVKSELVEGDTVLFKYKADYPITINGIRMFAAKISNLLCKWE